MDLVDLESRVAASPIATTCTRGVVVIEKKDMVEDSSREKIFHCCRYVAVILYMSSSSSSISKKIVIMILYRTVEKVYTKFHSSPNATTNRREVY